jgi:hypothetical protein
MRTAKVSRFFFLAGLHAINGCKNSHVFGKTPFFAFLSEQRNATIDAFTCLCFESQLKNERLIGLFLFDV